MQGRRPLATSFAPAIAAGALTLFFFAPRFVYWRSLEVGQWLGGPETNRAFATFDQIRDPWAASSVQANLVLSWRLFFPVLWHTLGLPFSLYLALPFVGCLLTLWLVASLALRRFDDARDAFLATALAASGPWFFVSTGWLTYFDSWLMLALLTVAFVPSRVALVVACVATPWIDERFVFGLPLIFLVRAFAVHGWSRLNRPAILGDAAIVAASSVLYPALRAAAWLRGDANSSTYVQLARAELAAVPFERFLAGLWSGFRAGWLIIAIGVWLVSRRYGKGAGATLGLAVAVTALSGLFIASDMSRTTSIALPVLVLGTLLLRDVYPSRYRVGLGAVVVANLLLPAEHVLYTATVPIRYLYAQIDQVRNPPPIFRPDYYLQAANVARGRQEFVKARLAFDIAVNLDPTSAYSHVARAGYLIQQGDRPNGERDVAVALRLNPKEPGALFLRAYLAQDTAAPEGVIADLNQALENAPPDWPERAAALQMIEKLKAR